MSFGLLDEGKKWRIKDFNFKREIIMAGLGWGHLAHHTIERELLDKKFMVINFENIHPRDLSVHLIRHKKYQPGVVAKALWNDLLSQRKGQ